MHQYTSFEISKLYLGSYTSLLSKDSISYKQISPKILLLKCSTQLLPTSYEGIHKFLLLAKLRLSKHDHYLLDFHKSTSCSKQTQLLLQSRLFCNADLQTFCTLDPIFHVSLQMLKKCIEKLCYKLQMLLLSEICLLVCLLTR